MASLKITTLLLAAAASVLTSPIVEKRQGNPECFNICAGINQTVYNQVINTFCNEHNGLQISQDDSAPGVYDEILNIMSYTPTPGSGESGEVLLAVQANSDASCGVQTISADTCIYNLDVPMFLCNVGSDLKQGGIYADPCLWWTIDPHPNGC